MALFRCTRSGNVVEFRHEHDIIEMRRHPEYTEVDTTAKIEVAQEDGTRHTITLKKPMGRPRKEMLL